MQLNVYVKSVPLRIVASFFVHVGCPLTVYSYEWSLS